MKKTQKTFDKYFYYIKSVQSPEEDIDFFTKTYQSIYSKKPYIFREDFCGTFITGLKWVKKHPKNQAIVIDKSLEPLTYGKKNHLTQLKNSDRKRLKIIKKSILSPRLESADIISVSNFSYFIFKEQERLLKYFKNVKRQLKKQGLFIIDVFGGSQCLEPCEESIDHGGFTYYWDQESFDPITHHGVFHIHFKRKNEKKRKKVFSYDWRMWSIPELKDILQRAGFSKTYIYWETSNSKGEGTGIFKKTSKGEPCETWIAYLVSKN